MTVLAPTFGPDRFGIAPGPASKATTETRSLATASADDAASPLHPHNPLLAFGVIAAVAFGLMAASTTVRVGKTKANISIGDSK